MICFDLRTTRWAIAAAIAAGTSGCLGAAPDVATDAAVDATHPTSEAAVQEDASDSTTTEIDSTMSTSDAGDDGPSVGDAAEEGEAAAVLPSCLEGGACVPSSCQTGVTACNSAAVQSCAATGNRTNGTPCDAGADASAVCNAGACGVCATGADCTEAGSCQQMNIACTSGTPVCAPNGNVIDGTSCGTSLFCDKGACAPCTAGASCAPSGKPCEQGKVSCSAGQVVCTDQAVPVGDGASCGTNMVCSAGSCVSCTANVACTPPGNPCHTGLTSCATGTSVCVDKGPGQNGVPCTGSNLCNGSYSCQGGTCTGSNPVTCPSDACHTAGTCNMGTGQCSAETPVADGTSCGTNKVCSGGTCAACTANVACTPPGTTCHAGSTSCGSGTSVCVDKGVQSGAVCTGSNPCNQTYTCNQSGVCVGSNPVACPPATDACHTAGTCVAATGQCSGQTLVADGTSCGGTSTNMTCSGGTCGCASGYMMCRGTCVTFGTDASNCGSCGHSCGGGQCTSGKCQPVALGNFDATPGGGDVTDNVIAADSAYVYAILNTSDGKIERCSVSGCTTGAEIVAQNQPTTLNSLFVNAAGVFWTSYGATSGSVGGCLPGNCPITYASYTNENAEGIVSDGQTVFWTLDSSGGGFDGISSCPVSGCSGSPTTVVTLSAVESPSVVVLSGNSLFFAAGSSNIQQAPKSGGMATPFSPAASGFEHEWATPAADAMDVAFVDVDAQTGTRSIFACPVTGCPSGGPIPIASPGGTPSIDSSGIYWSTGTAIQTCAASGCANSPATLASGIMSNPAQVALNSTAIFWVNGTTIWKLAK